MIDTRDAPSTSARRESPALRIARFLTLLAVACAVTATAIYLFVAVRRLGYRYELEWIEGGSLEHVRRVLHGHELYTRPTLAWTPNIYPPLYYWVAAAVAHVVGLGLPALRAVSIAASIAVAVAVWLLVREDTHEVVGPTIAGGFVFAMYVIGGAWYDLARVDSLFLALLMLGVVAARKTRRPGGAAITAVLLVLAIFTKQSALIPALAVLPWMWTRGRRIFATFALTFGGVGIALFAALQTSSHGWFTYYMWTVPSGHRIEHSAIAGFWIDDLGRHVLPMVVLAAGGMLMLWQDRRQSKSVVFHAPVFAALAFTAYTSRLHTGGWVNVLLPVYVGLAVLAGIAIGRVRGDTTTPVRVVIAALVLTIMQFAFLSYAPATQLPAGGTSATGDRIVATLRTLPQPVLITGQEWMLDRAGVPASSRAHASALQDVLRSHAGGAPARRLLDEFEDAVRSHRYCSVVVDEPAVFASMPGDLDRYYRPTRRVSQDGQLWPVTGTPIVPWEVWEPVGAPACGSR